MLGLASITDMPAKLVGIPTLLWDSQTLGVHKSSARALLAYTAGGLLKQRTESTQGQGEGPVRLQGEGPLRCR